MPDRTRAVLPKSWIFDCCALFALTAILIWPYFQLHQTSIWSSIESTFISDARMLNEPGTEGQWQPVWYAGTRSDYLYPPALRYGTAFLARTLHDDTGHAYHLYVSIVYCIGTLAVYLLIRTGNGSRGWAWAGAAGVTLLSPIFLLMDEYRIDSGHLVPHRLHVLAKYGEGPHISALCLLPLALAAMIAARRDRGTFWLSMSALAAALVVSNNFYGATALAILFPLLVWSYFLCDNDPKLLARGIGVALLAYLLTAFWLVPSYIRVTRDNLKLVAEPGKLWSAIVLVIVIVAYVVFTRRRKWSDPYRLWIFSSLFFMSLYVLGHRWFGFQVAGQSARLAPELDLVIILAGVEVLRWIHARRRTLALVMVFVAFLPAVKYVKHSWEIFPADPNWQSSVEFKSSQWVAENYPKDRVFATGSIRFWFDTWHSLRQVDGGSQQGILNPTVTGGAFCLSHCADPAWMADWMRALAIDLAVVPGKESQEVYHDIEKPEIWRQNFPLVHDDGAGNSFYRLPRRTPGVVRIVNSSILKLYPVLNQDFAFTLHPYAVAVEAEPAGGSDATRLRVVRKNSDEFSGIVVDIAPGEGVLVQESFDPAWHAYDRAAGQEKPVAIQKDPIGFMLIALPPGSHNLRLVFETPLETIAGRILAILASLFVLGSVFFFWRDYRRVS